MKDSLRKCGHSQLYAPYLSLATLHSHSANASFGAHNNGYEARLLQSLDPNCLRQLLISAKHYLKMCDLITQKYIFKNNYCTYLVIVVQQTLYKYNYKRDIDKYACCRITIEPTGGKRNTIHCTNMHIKR